MKEIYQSAGVMKKNLKLENTVLLQEVQQKKNMQTIRQNRDHIFVRYIGSTVFVLQYFDYHGETVYLLQKFQ